MPRYMREPSEVDAEQWIDPLRPPRGVLRGDLGPKRCPYFYVVTAQDRHVAVGVGEWIVREPSASGCFYPVSDDEFRRLYEPV